MVHRSWLSGSVVVISLLASPGLAASDPPAPLLVTRYVEPVEAVRDCYARSMPNLIITPYEGGYRLSIPHMYAARVVLRPQVEGTRGEVWGSRAMRRSFRSFMGRCGGQPAA